MEGNKNDRIMPYLYSWETTNTTIKLGEALTSCVSCENLRWLHQFCEMIFFACDLFDIVCFDVLFAKQYFEQIWCWWSFGLFCFAGAERGLGLFFHPGTLGRSCRQKQRYITGFATIVHTSTIPLCIPDYTIMHTNTIPQYCAYINHTILRLQVMCLATNTSQSFSPPTPTLCASNLSPAADCPPPLFSGNYRKKSIFLAEIFPYTWNEVSIW